MKTTKRKTMKTMKMTTKPKRPTAKRSGNLLQRLLTGRQTKRNLFILSFALVGAVVLFRTFAATTSVTYTGSFNANKPSASYAVSTGSGSFQASLSTQGNASVKLIDNSGTAVGQATATDRVSLARDVSAGSYTVVVSLNSSSKRNVKYSLTITYPTRDIGAPLVVIQSPNSDTVSGTVSFTATASDDTAISKVELRINGSVVASPTVAPYSYSWNTSGLSGTYVLEAKAYDTAGNTSQASRTVTVQSSSTPPPTAPPAGTTDFPNATNTGVPAGTVLKPSGTLWISTAGTVIDSMDVTGCIHVRANNVIIKRTRVSGSCPGGAIDTDYGSFSGIVIEDVEIDGLNQNSGYALLGNSGFTCRRCHIHNGGSGVRMTSNVTVEDSYIHSLYGEPGSHNSAVGSNGGQNFMLRHNTIDCGSLPQCSGALVFYAQPSVDNALVENNLINGGGFCTYGGYDPALPGAGTYIRYVNNKFGRTYYPNCGYHGPVAWFNVNNTGNQWSGNVWADTGATIAPPQY